LPLQLQCTHNNHDYYYHHHHHHERRYAAYKVISRKTWKEKVHWET
jgi:hypothetical protein